MVSVGILCHQYPGRKLELVAVQKGTSVSLLISTEVTLVNTIAKQEIFVEMTSRAYFCLYTVSDGLLVTVIIIFSFSRPMTNNYWTRLSKIS